MPPALLNFCICFLACLSAGCGDGQPGAPQFVSAMDNGRVEWPASVRLVPTRIRAADLSGIPIIKPAPNLILGTGALGPEDQFGGINGIAVDSASRVYVLDAMTYRVRVFSAEGAFIRDIGRRGQGPGDFQIGHDTLFVLDRIIHAFDTTGAYLRSSSDKHPYYNSNIIAATTKGLVFHFSPTADPRIRYYHLVTVDFAHDDAVVDSFSATQFFHDHGDGLKRALLPQFVLTYDVSSDGRVFFAVGDSFHLDVRALNGRLLKTILADPPRVPVKSSDIEDIESWMVETRRRRQPGTTEASARQHAANVRQKLRARPVARFRPAIGGIIVSSSGKILMSRPDASERPYRIFTPGDLTEWTMLDDTGSVLARVALPNAFSPKVFRNCELYGFLEGEDGSPLVVRFDLPGTGCDAGTGPS
jgi:hypothetical protein